MSATTPVKPAGRPSDVLAHIRPGSDLIVPSDNGEPVTVLDAIEAAAGQLEGVTVHQALAEHISTCIFPSFVIDWSALVSGVHRERSVALPRQALEIVRLHLARTGRHTRSEGPLIRKEDDSGEPLSYEPVGRSTPLSACWGEPPVGRCAQMVMRCRR